MKIINFRLRTCMQYIYINLSEEEIFNMFQEITHIVRETILRILTALAYYTRADIGQSMLE